MLVHGALEGTGRGAGTGRDMNAGAMPAKNIAATRINGHGLSLAATSESTAWLTGASSMSPSPLNRWTPRKKGGAARDYLLQRDRDIPLWGVRSDVEQQVEQFEIDEVGEIPDPHRHETDPVHQTVAEPTEFGGVEVTDDAVVPHPYADP